mgnify:CR=1 FL=1
MDTNATGDTVATDQEVSGSVESADLPESLEDGNQVNPAEPVGRFSAKTDDEILEGILKKSQTWFTTAEKTRSQEMELCDYIFSSTFTNELLAEKINLRTVTVSKVAHWNKTGSVRNTIRTILSEETLTKAQSQAVGNLQKLSNITLSLSDLAQVTNSRLQDDEFGTALALTVAQGGDTLREIKEELFPELWETAKKKTGPTESEIVMQFVELVVNKMTSRKLEDRHLFSNPATLKAMVEKSIALMGNGTPKNLIVRGKTNTSEKVTAFTSNPDQSGGLNLFTDYIAKSMFQIEEAVLYEYQNSEDEDMIRNVERAVAKQQKIMKVAKTNKANK